MSHVVAGSTADFSPGTMTGLDLGGEKILVANVDGALHGIQRKCPHMGFDLCKGRLDGATVICRMHGARFDLRTGEAVATAKLLFLKMQPKPARTFPVTVEGDRVFVDV